VKHKKAFIYAALQVIDRGILHRNLLNAIQKVNK